MKKVRKLVIGDIHGYHDQMMEVFEKANFNFETDHLISLGDLVDRGPKPIEVIEMLMQVRNFTLILGNHDDWFLKYLEDGIEDYSWVYQGGEETLDAYEGKQEVIERHREFLLKAKLYHIDDKNRLFVHAGFNPDLPFDEQKDRKDTLIWDRSMVYTAIEYEKKGQQFDAFSEIFVGHTPTRIVEKTTPQKFSNLWMIDTGVYLSGILTMMDIETREFWQSTGFEQTRT